MFEIEADEISDLWDSVGADEEPMGTRTTWEASIELPELGTLTWQLWEYPEGALNGTDTDVDGHELVSDFQITLEHDPEDSDAREADEAAIEEMIEWFHQNYEDPANRVPYESAEGGYQWIYGGPETPEKALGGNFGSVYRDGLIEHHGDEKLIVWHGLHGPVPILIHIRPCGSGKATPAARREAPC